MRPDTKEISIFSDKFNNTPPAICELLPVVLQCGMDAVRKRWKEGKESGNFSLSNEMAQVARAFVLFIGMLSIPFPQNVAYKLVEAQTKLS
jgi:hypothetical protein